MPGYALSVMLKYCLISYSECEVIGCFLLVLFSFCLNVLIFTVALICGISFNDAVFEKRKVQVYVSIYILVYREGKCVLIRDCSV